MHNIRIGFSTHRKNLVSKLITKYLGEPFSHTYISFYLSELKNPTVFHAVGKGLSFISKERFLVENEIFEEFEINIYTEQYLFLINKCHEAAGLKYGLLQNLGLVIANLFNLKNNPFQNDINCSEWIAECLTELDSQAFQHISDVNLITPVDIYKYLKEKHGKN